MAARVQLDLPFLRSAPPRPEPPIEPPTPKAPAIDFVRMRRARRYILRVRADGTVRVTVPRGGSRAEAVRFVEKHASWIQRERARVRSTHITPEWTDGATMLLRGERITIHVNGNNGSRTVRYGDRVVHAPGDLRAAIESDLRALAREELVPRLHSLAAAHGVAIARVTIRNQRSRWGSCSRSRAIALNFRLVQMPPVVSDYVLLHELMHVRQPNHSRSFWRLVEEVCPTFRAAEHWLKTEGRGLLA
jgi:predicted metal-dependent hydrolase